jgi:PLP dependent protein
MNIADQIHSVRQNIERYYLQYQQSVDQNPAFKKSALNSTAQPRLLAVSKTHPADLIQQAAENGITDFGESYLQEACDKITQLKSLNLCWHFIGPIQSNKTRLIAEHFDWVQSVDRLKILQRLSQQRPQSLAPLQICLQANLFAEPQKKGADREGLAALIKAAFELPNICLRGIMVIPPKQSDYALQLEQFQQVSQIYQHLNQTLADNQMDTLSMGMSSDMQAAIMSGSNMVRVGTALFGQREDK